MSERLLVTGGLGFIGAHLVTALVARGHAVRVLDNARDPARADAGRARLPASVDVRIGDVRDAHAVSDALRDATGVIHLAAIAGVRQSLRAPAETLDVNATGTATLLHAMRAADVRRLVLASSSSVYGDAHGRPCDERDPLRPTSPYAASKVAAEALAGAWHRLGDGHAVIVRPFTVYGPHQRPEMAIARLLCAAATGATFTRYGDGNSSRDYTYVDDVVALLERCLTAAPTPEPLVLNAAGGRPTPLQDLIAHVARITRRPIAIHALPDQPGDATHTWACTARTATTLDWRAHVTIDEGLARAWQATRLAP